MPTHLLSRKPSRDVPGLDLHPDIRLATGRVHEACGSARRSFALWLAGRFCERKAGPVLWISPAWEAGQLNPDGMMEFADPARFLFVQPRRAEDLLWCTEEALRSGAVPLVVADLPGAPALTPVRRMHLAAEQGGQMGHAPIGLLLTPGEGGAQGTESRWHMTPAHDGQARRWRLERRRARTLPPARWLACQTRPRTGLHLSRTEVPDT
ncbi:ImuA family protein [Primorskyibacter sp. S87]|uniref:ImuA family protein n=1 Tax=Primorskyibacter sp. S87 TaxID=3415126 RepID=UPI003C7BE29D